MTKKIFLSILLLFSLGYNTLAQQITPFDMGIISLESYNLYNEDKIFPVMDAPFVPCVNPDCSDALETAWAYALRAVLESRYLVKYNKLASSTPRFSVTDLLTNVNFTNIDKINLAGQKIYGKNNPIHAINYLTRSNGNSCLREGELDDKLYPLGIINEGTDFCANRKPAAYLTQLHMMGVHLSGVRANAFANYIKETGAALVNIPWNPSSYNPATKMYILPSNYSANLYLPVVIVGWKKGDQGFTARSSFIDGDFTVWVGGIAREFHIFSVDLDSTVTNSRAVVHYDEDGPNNVVYATNRGVIKEGITIDVTDTGLEAREKMNYSTVVKYNSDKDFRFNRISMFSSNTNSIKIEVFDAKDVDILSNTMANPLATGHFNLSSIKYSNILEVRNTGYYTIDLDKVVRIRGDFYVRATVNTDVLDLEGDEIEFTISLSAGVGANPVADKGKAWYSTNLAKPFDKDFAAFVTTTGTGAKPTIRLHLKEPWHINLDLENTVKYIGEDDPALPDRVYSFGDCGKYVCARGINEGDTLRFGRDAGETLGEYKYKFLKVTSNGKDLDTINIYRFHSLVEFKNRHLKIIQFSTSLNDSCSFAPYLSVDEPNGSVVEWEIFNVATTAWDKMIGETKNILTEIKSGTYRAVIHRKNQSKATHSKEIKINVLGTVINGKTFYTVTRL